MTQFSVPPDRWYHPLVGRFLRFAAGGWIPARWFLKDIPPTSERAAKTGTLHIEIVSHCWQYAHFLIYQLSSLVRFPPQNAQVTMTVYYCREDQRTVDLLNFFATLQVPNVHWNWCELPRQALVRRAIGRNQAALNSRADWVWFTDCDLMFRDNCLDELAKVLQGRRDVLVYPRVERCTSLLSSEDPMLTSDLQNLSVVDGDTSHFD